MVTIGIDKSDASIAENRFCYVFLIPADAYTLTSKDGKAPKVFHDKSCDSRNTLVRTFCEDCGSERLGIQCYLAILLTNCPTTGPVRSWIQGKEEQVVVRGGEALALSFRTIAELTFYVLWPTQGLFEPGVLPKPAVELYVKNNEEWESKVDGATHFEGMF